MYEYTTKTMYFRATTVPFYVWVCLFILRQGFTVYSLKESCLSFCLFVLCAVFELHVFVCSTSMLGLYGSQKNSLCFRISWNSQPWAAMWVLGKEARFSARATRALTHRTLSLWATMLPGIKKPSHPQTRSLYFRSLTQSCNHPVCLRLFVSYESWPSLPEFMTLWVCLLVRENCKCAPLHSVRYRSCLLSLFENCKSHMHLYYWSNSRIQ